MSGNISHGRGGAANIRPDDTPYTDGEIVREAKVNEQGTGGGPYMGGRGGAANIQSGGRPRTPVTQEEDVVPDVATRVDKQESHHVGRGGAGNETHVHEKKLNDDHQQQSHGLDKVKNLFHKK